MTFFSVQNLFTLAAWSFFLVQLGYLTYNAVYHPEMSTVLSTKPLFPGPLPLTLQVCVKPGMDEDKLRSYGYTTNGYTSFYTYYLGYKEIAKKSKTVVGWGGLNTKQGLHNPAGNHQI